MSFVKEGNVKEGSMNISVAEKCAWTKVNSCPWHMDVSSTRWAPRRVPRERHWPFKLSCGRRDRSSSCERCRFAENSGYTRSRGSSGRSLVRTPLKIVRRGRRWAYDAFYAPSSSGDETSRAEGPTSSSSAATSTPIADRGPRQRWKNLPFRAFLNSEEKPPIRKSFSILQVSSLTRERFFFTKRFDEKMHPLVTVKLPRSSSIRGLKSSRGCKTDFLARDRRAGSKIRDALEVWKVWI